MFGVITRSLLASNNIAASSNALTGEEEPSASNWRPNIWQEPQHYPIAEGWLGRTGAVCFGARTGLIAVPNEHGER